jgi:DNA-binding NtrC family response regulator
MEIETLFSTEAGDAVSRAAPPIVESPALRQVYEEAARASDGSVNVLILGEPGVGKTTLARWIHSQSRRARGPLVTLACVARAPAVDIALLGCSRHLFVGFAGDRPSALVAADGGTVILNSVHSVPLGAQAKLLRVFETREVARIGEVETRSIDIRASRQHRPT